jgi:hypothetical protein
MSEQDEATRRAMARSLLAGSRLLGIGHTKTLLAHLATMPTGEAWEPADRAALVEWLAAWRGLLQEGETIATTLAPLLKERAPSQTQAEPERHDEPLRLRRN